MMTVDDRTGSGDLLHYLQPQIPAKLGRLEFGDASFLGWGPGREPVSVGVEVKTVGDVLKCVCDGRFAGHQLPGLVASYQVVWLLIEGMWRRDWKEGVLQIQGRRGQWFAASVGARRFMWSDLTRWLLTMEIKGGIRVKTVRDRRETAQFLKDLYRWWTVEGAAGRKGWEEHRGHLAMNEADAGGWKEGWGGDGLRDRAVLVKPGLVRRMAAQLPGVGWSKSQAVADRFKSVKEMIEAGEKEWREVGGIGKKMAQEIVKELRGAGGGD